MARWWQRPSAWSTHPHRSIGHVRSFTGVPGDSSSFLLLLPVNSLYKFINNEQYNAKQPTQVTDFSCNRSVVCNKLYVVLNNIKAINLVFSIMRLTYPIIDHLWYPWNEHSKTNLGYIELLIYRSIYSGPLDFDISEFYCISITNGPIAFKFYTEVKYLKLHKKIIND